MAAVSPLASLFPVYHSHLHARGFRSLAISLPLPLLFADRARPRDHRRSLAARNSGERITARPSSELRRKSTGGIGVSEDEKLKTFRELFSGIGIDAYIIPSHDAHQSEFIADCFKRRAYITGFDGSAGTAVVTKDKAALWIDGRYFLQAEKQLGPDWTLMRSRNLGVPTTTEWLNEVLSPGCKIGVDPFLFSHDAAEELKKEVSKENHELVFLYDCNLVDQIWRASRPNPPVKPIRVHDIKHAGVDVSSKFSWLRSELVEAKCTATVISMLDEVAWLLNLRGNDVPHSPVFYSYLLVSTSTATLFVNHSKVTEEVMVHLTETGVQMRPYEALLSEIESLAVKGAKLLLDSSSVNAAIVDVFSSALAGLYHKSGNKVSSNIDEGGVLDSSKKNQSKEVEDPSIIFRSSPVSLAKALKNAAEIEGMRNAHLRERDKGSHRLGKVIGSVVGYVTKGPQTSIQDAAALVEFWAWLEDEIHKNIEITEVEVAEKLLQFRKKRSGFIDTSFETICGYGANGAIIHYRAIPTSCSVVGDKNLFLLDSGGQYVDGTTDITRTVHFGEPTSWQKECFTRVLQGHIALDQAIFPERTPGFVLDVLARSSLWKIGLDYRHGTGHGVGAALNVHEGPQSISFRYGNMTALQKGMIVSNEPGYYEDHSFGIRIEGKLVDCSLLSSAEIKWYNEYHSQVWEKHLDHSRKEERRRKLGRSALRTRSSCSSASRERAFSSIAPIAGRYRTQLSPMYGTSGYLQRRKTGGVTDLESQFMVFFPSQAIAYGFIGLSFLEPQYSMFTYPEFGSDHMVTLSNKKLEASKFRELTKRYFSNIDKCNQS
ncbi:Xaa-Pro aminopeptidase [Apostasia shenzhenica]|uniref:Xaa-Pro aminopeptidase n=1 Tax=Apostasia shenzhenica TaxID=1088818 RepID=A0A2I0API9_9ASPA|nr:Xaa-Pro aminopeptidase [Apostasia shenzhenica]